MVTVTIHGIPDLLEEDVVTRLKKNVAAVVASMRALKLKPDAVMVFFPFERSDDYKNIYIRVEGMPPPEWLAGDRTYEKVCERLAYLIQERYPNYNVRCLVFGLHNTRANFELKIAKKSRQSR